MIVRLTLTEDITAAIRGLALAMEDKQTFHQWIAFDLRIALVQQIMTVKVPKQDPGIEWWQHAADSIEVEATDAGAEVSYGQVGIRLRYYGGHVYPGKNAALSGPNAGNLTRALSVPTKSVPISGGAYVRPFRAGLLAFIRRATGGDPDTVGYLVTGQKKIATRGKHKGQEIIVPMPKGQGKLLYVLRSVTHHRPDTSFIPTDARLQAIIAESAKRFIDKRGQESSGD